MHDGVLFVEESQVLQLIVPNRTFQLYDLIGNFLGVLVAYFLVKIYLMVRKS